MIHVIITHTSQCSTFDDKIMH